MQNPIFLQNGWFIPINIKINTAFPPPPFTSGVGIPPPDAPPPSFSATVCSAYYSVDYMSTCQDIASMYGIDVNDLASMNPDGCTNSTGALPTSDLLCIVQTTEFSRRKRL